MSVTGAILCGGESSRMGQDKATLVLSGRTMTKWVADAMTQAGVDNIVTLGGEPHSDLTSLPDRRPGGGPLSALIGAIEEFGDVLLCPCDVPLVSQGLFAAIIEAGMTGERPVVLAHSDHLQPLIGLYKAAAKGMLAAGYEQGARGPKQILTPADFDLVDATIEEVQNINTPQEFEQLRDFRGASKS
ncbi:MAG: hypothetical protein CL460_01965 [Acidimicrobiaceae bacterium]|nr:hypothetical protein [Acidimicrobiaceae bacterium]